MLQKAENGEFDNMLFFYLDLISGNDRFDAYLKDIESPVQSVKILEAYVYGRKAETEGNTDEAYARRMQCAGFYDSDTRCEAIHSGTVKAAYEEACALFNESKWDEAYAIFTTIRGYEDSDAFQYIPRRRENGPRGAL